MPTFLRWLLALVAVAAVGVMGYAQYIIRLDPSDTEATLLLVAAGALAALLLGWEHRSSLRAVQEQPAPSRVTRAAATSLFFTGIAAVVIASYLLSTSWYQWFWAGWGILIAGTASLSLGALLLDPPRPPELRWSRQELLALLGIFAVGMFLRFHDYASFPDPYSIHAIEEPQTGMGGYKILAERTRPWEFFVDHYLAAAAIYLAEKPTILAIRVPFMIASGLAILPMYGVLRQLASKPAALAGTFLFAVSSWNIIYSRCAHNIFLTNLFVVLILVFLFAFGRTRRLAAIPWIGLLGGYTLYAYAGYRGTSLFVLAFLGGLFLVDLRRFARAADEHSKLGAARAVLRDGGAAAVVVGLVAALFAPVILITTSNTAQPYYYFEAANRSLSNRDYYTDDTQKFLQQRLDRIRKTAQIFMHRGDGSNTFNYPDEPMLDPLTAVCFVGGLLLALLYFWRRFNLFLLLMFLGIILGGAVFVQNLDVRRLQGATPFVAIFATLFLDRLWSLLRRLPRALVAVVAAVAVVGGGGFALAWNYNVYFNKMATDRRVLQAFKNHWTTIIRYGQTEGAGRHMLLLCDIWTFFRPSDYYWMIHDAIDGQTVGDLTDVLYARRISGIQRPTVVAQLPYELGAIARLLQEVYPGTACRDFIEPENPHTALKVCDLPAPLRGRPWTSSLRARYWLGPAAEGPPALERDEPFLGYSTLPPICYRDVRHGESPVCTAEWQATLTLEESRLFFLTERTFTRATVAIDGEDLGGNVRSFTLDAGEHSIAVRAQIPRRSDNGVRLEWATAPGDREVVPFYRGSNQLSGTDN